MYTSCNNKNLIKSNSSNSKPLEEILKSTIKLIDNSENYEKTNVKSNNETNCNKILIDNLKNIKNRTHKILNLYTDLMNKKC